MLRMIVDEHEGRNYLDVYVLDDDRDDALESNQNLSIEDAMKTVGIYRREYGFTSLEYCLFNGSKEISRKFIEI